MVDVTCPYCDYEFEIELEDELDGDQFDVNCQSCDKSFYATLNISYSTTTDKCDCLNDAEHDFSIEHEWRIEFGVVYCQKENCSEKIIFDEELLKSYKEELFIISEKLHKSSDMEQWEKDNEDLKNKYKKLNEESFKKWLEARNERK